MNKKLKILIIIITVILVAFIGCNVYATSQGYENIFFMIKYIFAENDGDKVVGKEELLSDRDIVISNAPVKINEDIDLHIEKIQIKDNQAILKLMATGRHSIEEVDYNLNYKVLDANDNILCEKENNKKLDPTKGAIIEELELKGFKDPKGKLKLEISTEKQRILIIKIDLEKREIIVESPFENNNEPEKISEIELKKYLEYLPEKLEYEKKSNEVSKVMMASIYYDRCLTKYSPEIKARIEKLNDGKMIYLYDKELVDTVLETMGFGPVEIEKNINDIATLELVQEDGRDYYKVYFEDHGTEDRYICLDILNIEYKNDLYYVTFNYYYTSMDVSLERKNADIREMTATFILNEEGKFTSRYRLKDIIEDKVSVKAENEHKLDWVEDITPENKLEEKPNVKPEEDNNYLTTTEWEDGKFKGISFKIPKNMKLEEYKLDGENPTEGAAMTGKVLGTSYEDYSKIDVKLRITVIEPKQATKEEAQQIRDNNLPGYTYKGYHWGLNDLSLEDEIVRRYRSVDENDVVRDIYFTSDKEAINLLNIEGWFLRNVEIDQNYNEEFRKLVE